MRLPEVQAINACRMSPSGLIRFSHDILKEIQP